MSWTTDLEKRLGCLMPKGERDIQQERIWWVKFFSQKKKGYR
jgi:hypothetical protein